MLKQLFKILGWRSFFIPDKWPEDIWDKAILMATVCTDIEIQDIDYKSFDTTLSLYSDSVDTLFKRLQSYSIMLRNDKDDIPDWKKRSRQTAEISLPDFLYSEKIGYWSNQTCLDNIIQYIQIIHHLFDEKHLDDDNPNTIYIKGEYASIAYDCVEFMQYAINNRSNHLD